MNPTAIQSPLAEKGSPINRQITFLLLGFDRPGLTNDVLNAVRLDGKTWFQGVRLEADGVRSEGHIQIQVDRPETADVLIQRLRAIAGLVRVIQTSYQS